MSTTQQEKFWQSEFGKEYTDRNRYDPHALDSFYRDTYGVSRWEMNKEFLGGLDIKKVLEVGANCGNQLALLQKLGYKDLYGIEILPYAIESAKQHTHNIHIIFGSGFDIPFKDHYFDLVFTSGVLIHIHPQDIKKIMQEIYRTSSKYIWGFEYYSETYQEIEYRGNKNCLWKGDFSKIFLELFHDLELVKQKLYPYKKNSNTDAMFLLKKNHSR